MKPHWDKLMEKFANHKTTLIADVDCTADGKSLCETVGVSGYPTLKHGDPNNLEDYKGGREYDDLEQFASDLGPLCSPQNMDLCSDEGRAEIERLQTMDPEELAAKIKVGESAIKDAEDHFGVEVQKLQDAYQQLQNDKDQTIMKVKKGGLGMMKSVHAALKKMSGGKTEL